MHTCTGPCVPQSTGRGSTAAQAATMLGISQDLAGLQARLSRFPPKREKFVESTL